MTLLTLRLLGAFQVESDGAPITRFGGEKVRALLAYLAVEPDRAHARASLAALLWPEQGDETALNNLSQTLVRLRTALGSAAADALLQVSRSAVQLRSEFADVDVATFTQLSASRELADLTQAAALYGGELLEGFSLPDCPSFEEWLLLRREQLAQQALSVLHSLAELHLAAGRSAAAAEAARRQLTLDPWHEAAHRQLMRALAAAGDRAGALNAYERCRQTLVAELGVEPDLETHTLAERIRTGELTPATRDSAAERHNLPHPLTPFVGRTAELAALSALRQQAEVRLLTLVGAGGMGKARLALELARTSLEAYADGVFFVALAPLAAAAELPSTIAQALELSLHGGEVTAALLRFLRTKQLLLVLDNFEHLREGVELVVRILEAAPQVQIIVTSREQLNVRGEHLYLVEGLEYAASTSQADAATSSAVRLFAQSARRKDSTFVVSEANLPAVLRICQLVQGMPLGLELAAAWAAMLPLDEIASEIARSADFLAMDWADAPERQRSMRAVFEWSWRLLSEAERAVLRQLSVFRGGFTREAAERIVSATFRVLTGLVHKSLLRRAEGGGRSAGRYELHELLRQFASGQLDAAPDERHAVEARHNAYYLGFVAERELRLARNQPREAAAEIQGEIDNVRRAWVWAATHTCEEEVERSLYGLWQFYALTGLSLEGEQAFNLAAERLSQAKDAIESEQATRNRHGLVSKLLVAQAHLMNLQGKYDPLILVARQAIALGHASGEQAGEAMGYVCWGTALFRKGQFSDAHPHFERAIQLARIYRSSGLDSELVREAEWYGLVGLGVLSVVADSDYDAGRTYLTQALHICQTLGKRRGECRCLNNLGAIAVIVGDYSAAAGYLLEGLRLARECGDRWPEGSAQMHLGAVAIAQGNYALARDSTASALHIFRDIGDPTFEAYTLAYLGRLADGLGNYERARDLLDRSLRLSDEIGAWEAQLQACLFLALLLHHVGDDEAARHYAEQSQEIAIKAGDRSRQADAWLVVGRAREGLHRLAEAVTAYQHALALYEQLGRAHMALEPRAGLARIAAAQGDLSLALAQVEEILRFLEHNRLAGPEEPFRIYLTCYRVLDALHDSRATAVLQQAQRLLQQYAHQIDSSALRQSFLQDVAAHRELLSNLAWSATLDRHSADVQRSST